MWFSSWLRKRKSSLDSTRLRPQLEVLEDRWLPSGFTFNTASAVGTSPQAVVTADVNGDGKLDLITANQGTYNATTGTYSGGGVSVLLGNGKGGFAAAQCYAVGSASSVAVGDLNGDGKLDIVTGSGAVLLNAGNGTFKAGPSYTGGLGSWVDLADVNHDGKLDLVTAGYGGTSVNVLLGNGDGTFRLSSTITTPDPLVSLTVGNFNGKVDIVTGTNTNPGHTASQQAAGTITLGLLPGNGDGTFGAAQTIFSAGPDSSTGTRGYTLGGVTAGDFNGDGKLDLAFADTMYSTTGSQETLVVPLLGNGDGTFPPVDNAPVIDMGPNVWTSIVGLSVGDFNGDGKLDLVAVGTISGGETAEAVLLGTGGSFGSPQVFMPSIGVSSATAFTVGDFNHDGYADLAVVGPTSGGYDAAVGLWKKN